MFHWCQYFFTLSFIPFLYFRTLETGFPEEPVVVHIVPHTHKDAGWVRTIDEYYSAVEKVFENVMRSLEEKSSRRFVYVEQIFFQRWWNQQNLEKKQLVKKFLQNGQFEFLNGGYVMNDEGCTYYDDIIEQMTLGHRFIKSEFNLTVNAAWHIDPFGHSAPQARLFSEMGIDSWFFERIDDADFENRKFNGELEMIWRPESYNRNRNYLMAHVNYMKYYVHPTRGCIPVWCGRGDLNSVAHWYGEWIRDQAAASPTRHIFHQAGGDFEWWSEEFFPNMEVLINFFDKNPQYNIKMEISTPSRYVKAVYKEISEKNIHLAENVGDFFPYRDSPNAFWTGYFTSKPHLKRIIREASTYLQSVKKLLSKLYFQKRNLTFSDIDTATDIFEAALSILQHHDAAPGTAKKYVDHDYERILIEGYQSVHKKLLPVLTKLFEEENPQSQIQPFSFFSPLLSNLSTVNEDGSHHQQPLQTVVAYVYNPSQIQSRLIRFEVPGGEFGTLNTNLNNTEIDCDVICNNKRDRRTCEIWFMDQVGTNQLKSYIWTLKNNSDISTISMSTNASFNITQSVYLLDGEDYCIDLFNNETLVFKKGNSTNMIYTRTDGTVHSFSLIYGVYQSFQKKDIKEGGDKQISGAYIFRAINQYFEQYGSTPKGIHVKKGRQIIEIEIVRETLITTRLRFYNMPNRNTGSGKTDTIDAVNNTPLFQTIEIETVVEEIPVDDGRGKEIILAISDTGIHNEGIFYTTSNGLENQRRVRNSVVDVRESVAGNYYPVNSAIYIEDRQTGARVTLMNDRSQGGSSLQDGSIEVMINRRIVEDDDRGVNEPLNDERAVQVRHWLFFSKGSLKQRSLQYDFDTQPLIYVSTITNSPKTQQLPPPSSSPPPQSLPVQIVGQNNLVKFYIRIYGESELLVRLHNLREDQPVLIQDFFNKTNETCRILQEELLGEQGPIIKVKDIKEVTLTTVQEKREMLKKKYRWDGKGEESLLGSDEQEENGSFENISLGPLEERVFILTYST